MFSERSYIFPFAKLQEKCISPWLGEKMRYNRQLYVQKKNSEMGNNEAAKSYKQKKRFLILQTLF